MKRIRVLQVHNLGIYLEGNTLSALFEALDKKDLLNKIDYLAVCGNLTRDRSAESFEQAKSVLRDLVLNVLPIADLVANRVILVPGPLDVPDPDRPDFATFKRFYEEFFQEEFGIAKIFDPQKAEVRDLKDLTLIGLTYWKSTNPEVSRKRV